jgi:hypothetical protein
MPSLTLVEVIERITSLYFGSCGSVVGRCIAHETSSSDRLVIGLSTALVMYMRDALLLGAATPIYAILDSQLGSHISAHFYYLIVFIPQ